MPIYLYLTTTGRITGQQRRIEIWFTEHGGRFYLIAERESANWVRNIQSQPQVKVLVGAAGFKAFARVVCSDREPQLGATVKALFDAKYAWSDGLIVELTPSVTFYRAADSENRGDGQPPPTRSGPLFDTANGGNAIKAFVATNRLTNRRSLSKAVRA